MIDPSPKEMMKLPMSEESFSFNSNGKKEKNKGEP